MTVSSTENLAIYTGNGATTEFSFPFYVVDEEDLVVTRYIVATGELDYEYSAGEYTVSGIGDAAGGLVTITPALSSTYKVYIERVVDYTQPLDLVNQTGFYPDEVERQFDRTTMQIQQLAKLADRSFHVPRGEQGGTIPSAEDRAGYYFGFDAEGDPVMLSGTGADGAMRTDLAASTGSSLVGFLQSGTGAESRSVQSKLRDTISVLDFGAVADGVTDDVEAIQAAIDEANGRGGGVVMLPAGTIAFGAPIVMKSNVTLKGAGRGNTVLLQVGTVAAWYAYANRTGLITTYLSAAEEYTDIHVADLTLQGIYTSAIPNGAGPFAKNGISLGNVAYSSVRRCEVLDTGTGLVLYGTVTDVTQYENIMEDCTVRRARSWNAAGNPGAPRGITMATQYSHVRNCLSDDCYTGYYVATENGSYTNCKATQWTDDGYYVNANHVTFVACEAFSPVSGSGFAVNPCVGTKLIGCKAYACPNAGIRLRHVGDLAPSEILIDGCEFDACGYGFLDDMTGANAGPVNAMVGDMTISNSLFRENDYCGIKMFQQRRWKLLGNTIRSNNTAGVTLQTRGGISLDKYCIDGEASNNTCADTQGTPTQTLGLYSYLAADSGAASENTGNRINHKSITGTDLFYPMKQTMSVEVTILSGQRNGTALLTYPMRFEEVPKLALGGVQDGSIMTDAERPVSGAFTSAGTQSVTVILDAHANVAANRVLTCVVEGTYP